MMIVAAFLFRRTPLAWSAASRAIPHETVDLVRGGLLMLVYAVGYTFGTVRPIRSALTFPGSSLRSSAAVLMSTEHVCRLHQFPCSGLE